MPLNASVRPAMSSRPLTGRRRLRSWVETEAAAVRRSCRGRRIWRATSSPTTPVRTRTAALIPTMSQIVALSWSTREAVKLMVMTDRCWEGLSGSSSTRAQRTSPLP